MELKAVYKNCILGIISFPPEKSIAGHIISIFSVLLPHLGILEDLLFHFDAILLQLVQVTWYVLARWSAHAHKSALLHV